VSFGVRRGSCGVVSGGHLQGNSGGVSDDFRSFQSCFASWEVGAAGRRALNVDVLRCRRSLFCARQWLVRRKSGVCGSCMGLVSRVGGWSYWFSGFCFERVKLVGRGSWEFTVQCLVCRGRVFGLNRYPFWYESDHVGAFSGLLSADCLVFRCGPHDPPSPLSLEKPFSVSFSGGGSYFRLTGLFFVP
jgi:hypothetical protein